MLGIIPVDNFMVILKYIDEVIKYDKDITDNIYYGEINDSTFIELNDNYDDNDSQDNNSYSEYIVDNFPNNEYFFSISS